ncbi:hypothetical protein CB1_056579060 [Camelus ferus]|nr:hypothetical protein CB1_056579060 [Camelus ferus]
MTGLDSWYERSRLCPLEAVEQFVDSTLAFKWIGFEAVNKKASCCQGQSSKREKSDANRGGMTPWFNGWGFNLPRGQSLLDKWNLIPEGIDILMTHGPPLGFRDWVPKELQRVGCVELLNTVQRRVRPKLHVFGGIHEGYGIMTDGYTTYINASACTVSFQPTNPPIIFDLPNPQGS